MPLEDYLDPQDEATIQERMLATLPADWDRSEGGPIHDLLMPAALELALADDRLRLIMDWGFASTTFGEYLDMRADEHGLVRRGAVQATGSVTFSGTDGTLIPAGTELSTPTTEAGIAQRFTTNADATIAGGVADVAITAVEGGVAGNVGIGTITLLSDPGALPGVTVTNAAATSGGLDEETDEELLVRYLLRVRNPGSSGNQADYVNWALEVPGVGGAAVVPLEGGPGTVTVAIIDLDKRAVAGAPLAALVAAVQAYIAPGGADTGTGKAPIGAAVTVEAATEVAVNLAADLTIAAGYTASNVEAVAEAAYEDYLASLAFAVDNDVRIARVITLLLDTPGVTDATSVTLNGGTTNVAIAAKEVAVKGTVTFT